MRKLSLLLGVLLALAAGLAGAVELREGKHYTVFNPPQPTEARDKVEVTEYFWYGCSHCFNLDPLLAKWVKRLPKDVNFRRVPAIFQDGRWAPGAKLFYTLEAMGLLDRLHTEVFDAIHIDRVNLADDRVLFDWIAKKDVDAKKFADTYNSFAIQSKVMRAQQQTQALNLNGVPALVVDGRYMPATGAAGSYGDVLGIVDQLIDKARKDRAGKK